MRIIFGDGRAQSYIGGDIIALQAPILAAEGKEALITALRSFPALKICEIPNLRHGWVSILNKLDEELA